MKILGIIPSRYASTRFPGKPLAMINGKTMIQRVYEQAGKCESLTHLVVATDHDAIYNHVVGFGGDVVMTSQEAGSGTERCFEALNHLKKNQSLQYDVVINIQGDEPFISPTQIYAVTTLFTLPEVKIGTLIKKISTENELNDPNIVKVVRNVSKEALYFSRAAIPHRREKVAPAEHFEFYKHIGVYGYRSETLKKLIALPVSNLEKAESLEQLRWLENGFKIQTAETEMDITSIDTYEDLIKYTKT
ncbi:MAG: 3-deoxy-manno-octulosonate cytidylyltransferase [Bacteroidales bacterium]|nr:3-deoxy-manno-octulosonate cytidylyltransferase [Bacteroidales bacterium]MCF8334074.1 3-deoxy-manno-octulosonate cytidylyltransferase [Bacteroidales bacterium]